MNQLIPKHHLDSQLLEVGDAKSITNPIGTLLPREVRGPVNRLWACNSHLLPSSLSLASTIRVFMDDHGLRVEDVPEICTRMMSPDRRAGHKFASDFFTDLASIVAEVVRRRRSETEQQKRQRNDSQDRQIAGSPRMLLDQLRAQIGRDVNQQEESA